MRKVILFNMVSLDGYFEGQNHDINWHRVDEEFDQFAIEQLNTAGALIFGRVTYQLMADFWPTPDALETDPIVAERMNALPKVVFSRTLESVEWNNTRLMKGDAAVEVSKLKQQPGNDLFVFGSADLAATLIQNGLIDEFRIIVNPVVLGSGTPMFKDMLGLLHLDLIKTRIFRNGNVLLYYEPARGEP